MPEMKINTEMKKIIIALGILVIFLVSGCIEMLGIGFGPEGAVKVFYSELDKGNYEKAANKTTIPIDKDLFVSDAKKVEAFTILAKSIFGDDGERITLGTIDILNKTEIDTKSYESRYKGNLTNAYSIDIKVPLKAEANGSIISFEVEGYRYLTHEVFKVNGNYYVRVDLKDLKDFVIG